MSRAYKVANMSQAKTSTMPKRLHKRPRIAPNPEWSDLHDEDPSPSVAGEEPASLTIHVDAPQTETSLSQGDLETPTPALPDAFKKPGKSDIWRCFEILKDMDGKLIRTLDGHEQIKCMLCPSAL